jgi:hypothetical protein
LTSPRRPTAQTERNDEIRRRYAAGESQRALASEFGIDRTRVQQIVHPEHWRAKDVRHKRARRDRDRGDS